MFQEYLERWNLTPDGAEIVNPYTRLLPVRYRGEPAMLKLALEDEERRGAELLAWWDGEGAVRVFEIDGPALLMERIEGERSLMAMARYGADDEATRILCEVTMRLHAPRNRPLPELISLDEWFEPLAPGARQHGGLLTQADEAARELLGSPEDVVVLHGDMHHENVLDGGARGWLAIDPKRLIGERGFDYVNIVRNPEDSMAADPARFDRQVNVIVEAANLDRTRFLKWILAFTGLSAAWILEDGDHPEHDLAMAALAADALAR